MSDKLKSILVAELDAMTKERDKSRSASLEAKEAADKLDRQVNRLTHFLTEYEDRPEAFTLEVEEGPKKRQKGLQDKVIEALRTVYPDFAAIPTIKVFVEEAGLNGHSVGSCVARLCGSGRAVKKTYSDGSVGYALVIPNFSVDERKNQ